MDFKTRIVDHRVAPVCIYPAGHAGRGMKYIILGKNIVSTFIRLNFAMRVVYHLGNAILLASVVYLRNDCERLKSRQSLCSRETTQVIHFKTFDNAKRKSASRKVSTEIEVIT